jgi:uncharacterized protein YbjT (DUF2867 family)
MTKDKLPILVFGATGRQGGSVLRALMAAGWPVRALVRDRAAPASLALQHQGAEPVEAALSDVDAIRRAMAGVHGVFSVLPGDLPAEDEVRFGTTVADIAAESGVRHLVYSSGASVGDRPTGIPRFDAKPKIESHIRRLPISATIVRPMIFMEMLVRHGLGLERGQLISLVRPDQTMQLVAVEDIGKFVAAIFADQAKFSGQTLILASDTVTGTKMASDFSEAAGRQIAYARFTDEVFAANPDLGQMAASLENGPLSRHADLEALRKINPDMLSLRGWLAHPGRALLEEALRP